MFLTVTCNPSLDWMMRLRSFAEGATNRSQSDSLAFGGKGVNVSTMLHRFGQPTCASGFIAGVTGQALVEGVQKQGVPCDFVTLSNGQTRINVKMKHELDSGDLLETEINGRGPEVDAAALDALAESVKKLAAGDWLVLSGSLAPGCPDDLYFKLATTAKGNGANVVVDTTGKAFFSAIESGPFLVKPNNHELAEMAGCSADNEDELVEVALALIEKGTKYVLISCGGAGALLVGKDGLLAKGDAPKGTLVNSVGAGDSMVAGFLAGYSGAKLPGAESLCPGEKDPAYALRFGLASGSATAFSVGLADAEEVARLISVTNIPVSYTHLTLPTNVNV